jgi:PAS domain S-box-containing protein
VAIPPSSISVAPGGEARASARRDLDEELRDRAEQLRLALEAGRMGSWEWEIASETVRWSPTLEAIHGLAPGTFGGTFAAYLSDIHAEDRARVIDAIRGTVERGEEHHLEYRIVWPDGTIHWLEARGTVMRSPSGEPLRVLGICRDVSERKRAEQELRESEERFGLFMRHLPGLAWIKDADGRYVFVNEAAEAAFRTPRDRLYGRTDEEIFPAATAAAFRENDRRALGEGALQTLESLEHEDGVVHHSIVAKFPIVAGDGRRFVGGTAIDVTERIVAEQRLRESEHRYRAVVESQSEMVCRFRPDGRILFANGAYARACGTTPEALLEASFWDFVAEEERERVRVILDGLRPESPEARIENRFETVGGPRWTLWTNRALAFDDEGRVREAQSTGIDITDRRRAEEALREADRRKDEFLATLAHELRNPLAPLRSGLEIMKRTGAEPDALERTRAMMERQVLHMVRLIDDLLDLGRISRGRVTLRRERVSLESAIRQAVETCRPAVDAADHSLRIEVPTEPLVVDGDPVRLAQVFANLLGNAAKFSGPRGRIELAVERDGTDAVVRVRDDGIGIPPERLPELFDVFTRIADPAHPTSELGLGIGLSLVKRLVELHDGAVDARSDGPGTGSEFVVRLPLVDAPPSVPAEGAEPAAVTVGRRILVVDDNADAATSLATLLELCGHSTAIAFDGAEALDAAERFAPDAILLDVGMPKLDGYETARRIRALPWGRRVLLVAVTGWGQEADQRRSREAGFDHHLVKPVDPARIAELLASACASAGRSPS